MCKKLGGGRSGGLQGGGHQDGTDRRRPRRSWELRRPWRCRELRRQRWQVDIVTVASARPLQPEPDPPPKKRKSMGQLTGYQEPSGAILRNRQPYLGQAQKLRPISGDDESPWTRQTRQEIKTVPEHKTRLKIPCLLGTWTGTPGRDWETGSMGPGNGTPVRNWGTRSTGSCSGLESMAPGGLESAADGGVTFPADGGA